MNMEKMTKEQLLELLKNNGYSISEEVHFGVSHLFELLDAQGNDDITAPLKWLEEKSNQTKEKTYFNPDENYFPVSSANTKTLRYIQNNVHDFAWFADKRFNVLKGSVKPFGAEKEITTWVMFTNANGDLWLKSIDYINEAIYGYSLYVGNYPYNNATAVDGTIAAGGGMEYPNITVIGSVGNSLTLRNVIVHEVGHNWFYGILGSNERDFPWMDEGINSYYTNRIINAENEKMYEMLGLTQSIAKFLDIEKYNLNKLDEFAYLLSARKNVDQPFNINAEKYSFINYQADVYSKGNIIFRYLQESMGNDFDNAMKEYFYEWKFKHPQPDDLKNIFTKYSKKDLSWFFNDLMQTTKKIDYKISSVKKNENGDSLKIKIKNKGDIASPFTVSTLINKDEIKTNWFDGFYGKKKITIAKTIRSATTLSFSCSFESCISTLTLGFSFER